MFTISTFTVATLVLLVVLGFAARKRNWQGRSFLPLAVFLVVNLGWTFLGDAWLEGKSYLPGMAMAAIRDPSRSK